MYPQFHWNTFEREIKGKNLYSANENEEKNVWKYPRLGFPSHNLFTKYWDYLNIFLEEKKEEITDYEVKSERKWIKNLTSWWNEIIHVACNIENWTSYLYSNTLIAKYPTTKRRRLPYTIYKYMLSIQRVYSLSIAANEEDESFEVD